MARGGRLANLARPYRGPQACFSVTTFVLTGPESTGKSELAVALARKLSGRRVPEVARDYLSSLSGRYKPSDLLRISELQARAEAEARTSSNPVVCDTDQQVIYIWWSELFGPVPDALLTRYRSQAPRHYLLCMPDLDWTPDPQRENPHDRDRLYDLYEADLSRRRLGYSIITGQGDERLKCALRACSDHLQ